jgi:hypothetical protein
MKLAAMIMLPLLSLNCYAIDLPSNLSPKQIFFINNGHGCCYSKEVLAEVQQATFEYEYPPAITLDLPPLKEPASPLSWAMFTALQLLDIYTTVEAVKYDCIEEANPLLDKKPELHEIVFLKSVVIIPAMFIGTNQTVLTDEDFASANYFMAAIVANNFHVWSRARKDCSKNR